MTALIRSAPVPAFGLRLLCVAPLAAAALLLSGAFGGVALAGEPCGTPGLLTTTVYLPNITKTLGGPAGWVTPFYIQNAGALQTTVETSFFRFSDAAECRRFTNDTGSAGGCGESGHRAGADRL